MFLYIFPDDGTIRQSDIDPTETDDMLSVRAEELIVIRFDPAADGPDGAGEFQKLDANGAWNPVKWLEEL